MAESFNKWVVLLLHIQMFPGTIVDILGLFRQMLG
jgi:hypothetical protein